MNSSKNKQHTAIKSSGFTLIELMITVAVIAILATIALPSTLVHRQQKEISQALRMTEAIRQNITNYYYINHSFPSNNKKAGIPKPDLLIGNLVTSIEIEKGAIHITFGNKAVKPLQAKILSLRPAIVIGSPNSPISWLCGADKAVQGMKAIGENKTDLANAVIPVSCGN